MTDTICEEEEKVCLHCGEVLPVSLMQPLEDGTPGNMCKREWREYEEQCERERPLWLAKWREDVKKEAAEGERRETLKRMSKAEKEKVAVAGHSLRLVK